MLCANELRNDRCKTYNVNMIYGVTGIHANCARSKNEQSGHGPTHTALSSSKHEHRAAAADRGKLLLSTRTGHEPRPTVYIV
jgi:hypothetical protein